MEESEIKANRLRSTDKKQPSSTMNMNESPRGRTWNQSTGVEVPHLKIKRDTS